MNEQKHKWISVADRYPDDARGVLTKGPFGVHSGCFEWGTEDDPCWWSPTCLTAAFKTSVTHWAEIAQTTERKQYEEVKTEILAAIDRMRRQGPVAKQAADYLLEHMHMDDERMTFMYDGDPTKLQITKAVK